MGEKVQRESRVDGRRGHSWWGQHGGDGLAVVGGQVCKGRWAQGGTLAAVGGDGLIEWFNQTLKAMLRKAVSTEGKGWDKLIPCLLLYWKVWRASTGFAVFELLYGRQVWGPLDVLKETWEANRWSGESVVSGRRPGASAIVGSVAGTVSSVAWVSPVTYVQDQHVRRAQTSQDTPCQHVVEMEYTYHH